MDGFDLTADQLWKPLSVLGFKHPFFTINGNIVIQTWIILLILFGIVLFIRYFLRYKQSIPYFLTTTFVRSFIDLTNQTLGSFFFNHLAFICSLFTFILICNSASTFPWLKEPTSDLNTTLALGIISFLYIQWHAIQTHGLWSYITSYFAPVFFLLPLNLMGKLSNIISISFRLFGNIFGGSVIGAMYQGIIKGSVIWETIGLLSGLNFIILFFFSLFEGFLQAFVFSILSLTYLSIAIQKEGPPKEPKK